MYKSSLVRKLACVTMVASMVAMTPALAEASGAKSRSTAERRLKPGKGYFANSHQNRSRSATRASSGLLQGLWFTRNFSASRNVTRAPAQRSAAPVTYRYVVPRGAAPGTVVRVPVVHQEKGARPVQQGQRTTR